MTLPVFKVGGVPEHFNLPWHLAIEEGRFREKGFDVEWVDCAGGTGQMTRELEQGSLDLAVLVTEGIVSKILNGAKERILQFFVETPLRWGIHVASDAPFEEVEDLRGKRFGITRYGSGSELMVRINAQRMGWSPDELQWVLIGDMEGARKALRNGNADAYLCEQFTTQFLVDQGEFKRLDVCEAPWPAFSIAVRDDLLQSHPKMLRKLLEGIDESNKAFMERHDATNLVADRYELELEAAEEWFHSTRWATSSNTDPKVLDEVQSTLSQLGIVPGTMDSSSLLGLPPDEQVES